jgi:hypothetical protein
VLKLLLVAAVVAGVVYAVFWALERRQAAGRAQRQHPSARRPRPRPSRMVAPDDDEDFLRDLDRRRREKDEPG